jgi:hypothetical protein
MSFVEYDVAHSAELPDGQISARRVQPLLQKYFCSLSTQITGLFHVVPALSEGAYRDRHERGLGCGGREGAFDEQR